jgi:hypothetical protein
MALAVKFKVDSKCKKNIVDGIVKGTKMALSETGTEVRYESKPFTYDFHTERSIYGQLNGNALLSLASRELVEEISKNTVPTWVLLITHEDTAVHGYPYVYGGFEANYFQNYGWGFVSTARMEKGRIGNAHGAFTGYHEIATHGIGYGHCDIPECVHYRGQHTDDILRPKIARFLEEGKMPKCAQHASIKKQPLMFDRKK